jgi:aryl-alcohol dehydrogenase-like predicted oxidoreductase
VQSIQNAYNLLNRTFEVGGSEIAHREDVGLLAYSPIAQGYLSGKYQNGALPKGSRKELFDRLQRYEGPYAEEAIQAYLDIGTKYNIDPSQLANQFVTSKPFVTSNIIGATNMDQLKLAVTSIEVNLTEEIYNDIEKAFQKHGNVAS